MSADNDLRTWLLIFIKPYNIQYPSHIDLARYAHRSILGTIRTELVCASRKGEEGENEVEAKEDGRIRSQPSHIAFTPRVAGKPGRGGLCDLESERVRPVPVTPGWQVGCQHCL